MNDYKAEPVGSGLHLLQINRNVARTTAIVSLSPGYPCGHELRVIQFIDPVFDLPILQDVIHVRIFSVIDVVACNASFAALLIDEMYDAVNRVCSVVVGPSLPLSVYGIERDLPEIEVVLADVSACDQG